MKAIDQALETIKTNKIGKGCKISHSSNKIYIDYPIHKTLNGQYNADIRKVRELFTDNHLDFCCIQNKGGINIWI